MAVIKIENNSIFVSDFKVQNIIQASFKGTNINILTP